MILLQVDEPIEAITVLQVSVFSEKVTTSTLLLQTLKLKSLIFNEKLRICGLLVLSFDKVSSFIMLLNTILHIAVPML